MSTLITAVAAALFIGLLSFWVQEAAGFLLVVGAGGLLLAAVLLLLGSERRGPGP